MKQIILMSLIVGLTACGKVKTSGTGGNATAAASTSSTDSGLSGSQAQGAGSQITNSIVNALLDLFKNGFNGVTTNGNNISVNQTENCPLGGTVTLTGHMSSDFSATLPSISGHLTNGSGSLAFVNCRFPDILGQTMQLNGTTAVSQFSTGGTGTLNLSGNSSFTDSGTLAMTGSLSITDPSYNGSCTMVYNSSFSTSGNIDSSTLKGAANSTANVTGTLCGQSINKQENFSTSF